MMVVVSGCEWARWGERAGGGRRREKEGERGFDGGDIEMGEVVGGSHGGIGGRVWEPYGRARD